MATNNLDEIGQKPGNHSYSLSISQLPSHNHTASCANSLHSHSSLTTGSGGSHNHSYTVYGWFDNLQSGGADKCWRGPGSSSTSSDGNHAHSLDISNSGTHNHSITIDSTGSGTAIDNRPASYKLAFIMKL